MSRGVFSHERIICKSQLSESLPTYRARTTLRHRRSQKPTKSAGGSHLRPGDVHSAHMSRPSRDGWRLLGAAAATFVASRGALHLATWRLPLSNDDAIPMLQAGLLLRGQPTTTLINQPYNGTLDSWLMAPALLVAEPQVVFRLYELAC